MVLESHLQCAAEELPVDTERDHVYFGSQTKEICEAHLMPIDTRRGVSGSDSESRAKVSSCTDRICGLDRTLPNL